MKEEIQLPVCRHCGTQARSSTKPAPMKQFFVWCRCCICRNHESVEDAILEWLEATSQFGSRKTKPGLTVITSPRTNQQPEPEVLALKSASANDSNLPPPRGKTSRKKVITRAEVAAEAAKLRRTMETGGLVPDGCGNSSQPWMCPDCGEVHSSKEGARECHGTGASRVQACWTCSKRAADCRCPKARP